MSRLQRDLYLDDETVRRTRVRYCSAGLQAALETATAPGNEPLLSEQQLAYLTAPERRPRLPIRF